jgi:hypothetical protein
MMLLVARSPSSFSAESVRIPTIDPEVRDDDSLDTSGPRIRCPLCHWSPRENDVWACQCGHTWNTFQTGGVCPSCLFQWTETQCLACGRWSPHSDWYENRE